RDSSLRRRSARSILRRRLRPPASAPSPRSEGPRRRARRRVCPSGAPSAGASATGRRSRPRRRRGPPPRRGAGTGCWGRARTSGRSGKAASEYQARSFSIFGVVDPGLVDVLVAPEEEGVGTVRSAERAAPHANRAFIADGLVADRTARQGELVFLITDRAVVRQAGHAESIDGRAPSAIIRRSLAV